MAAPYDVDIAITGPAEEDVLQDIYTPPESRKTLRKTSSQHEDAEDPIAVSPISNRRFDDQRRQSTVSFVDDVTIRHYSGGSRRQFRSKSCSSAGAVSLTSSVSSIEGSLPGSGKKKRKPKLNKWSIIQLRKLFKDVGIDNMYKRYQLRLHRLLLFKAFVIYLVYNVAMVLTANIIGFEDRRHDVVTVNVYLAVNFAIAAILAVLVFIRRIFLRISLLLGIFAWIFINMTTFSYLYLTDNIILPMTNVPNVFYSIFVIHTMLPLSRPLSIAFGTLTGIADLVTVGVMSDLDVSSATQMVANAIIYLCSNLTGVYHNYLTDIAHRHTFLDTRRFLEADIKFSKERDKQTKMKETLLQKILPKHLLSDVKKVLNRKLVDVNYLGPKRVFHELLVERHDDVSILFADIVSFTPLTTALDPADLVTSLNELFGRFDELAEHYKCFRIKMLGDCYYCVCGLPEPIADHAQSTIRMGLQMIKVIRDIREETGVTSLDMRIGVHTGYVLSGVLGLQKWQYDIWSDSVTIANHMESGGMAGKVHLTESTLKELKGTFKVDPGNGEERDDIIKQSKLKTYFIANSELERLNPVSVAPKSPQVNNGMQRRPTVRRRHSVAEYMESWGAEMPFNTFTDYLVDKTIPEMHEVNNELEKTFHLQKNNEKPSDRDKLQKTLQQIRPVSLMFKKGDLEELYSNMKDSSFKFYIGCAFLIFILMVTVHIIQLEMTIQYITSISVCTVGFITLIVLTTSLKCLPFYSRFSRSLRSSLHSTTRLWISNRWLKTLMTSICLTMIFTISIIPIKDCNIFNEGLPNGTVLRGNNFNEFNQSLGNVSDPIDAIYPCIFAPYYLYTCMLALISCSVFLRVSHLVKAFVMLVGLIIFNVIFYYAFQSVFDLYDAISGADFLPSKARGSVITAVVCVTLLVLDRQIERNMRIDFLCKNKMKEDKEEVQRNELLNEVLLTNILPRHVANHFMTRHRDRNELYHQTCKNACVMFAAIPDFRAFFSEIDVTGNECLRLLNEIISCFDKMLIMRKYDGVEKIKTIGSTYMVAAGLSNGDDTTQDDAMTEKNLLTMVRFAFAMRVKLEQLSHHAFYDYHLRIGINHGEVIAGVVGARKPQYDIWGDAVNVASRMESHGVIGRVQVPGSTAEILSNNGVVCEYRSAIQVKGKGKMDVYLVSDECALLKNVIERIDSTCPRETGL